MIATTSSGTLIVLLGTYVSYVQGDELSIGPPVALRRIVAASLKLTRGIGSPKQPSYGDNEWWEIVIDCCRHNAVGRVEVAVRQVAAAAAMSASRWRSLLTAEWPPRASSTTAPT